MSNNKDIIMKKLENVVSSENMTEDVQKRIEDISKFTDRLEKMDLSLKNEFFKVLDDIIDEGNVDNIILDNSNIKRK